MAELTADSVVLSEKIDTLNNNLNRLSNTFEDYVNYQQHHPPAAAQGQTMVKKQSPDGPAVKMSETEEYQFGQQDFTKDENEERGNWTGRLDFLLSCLGYAVGLGNVWRFPYLCYKNGGAVFFIPYIIMLAFVGIPIFFMELSLGQFTSSGPLTCWEMAPWFKGIGYAMLIVSSLVGIYYNMIIAWAIYYLFASFTGDLPWSKCRDEWSSDFCSTDILVFKDAQLGMDMCNSSVGLTAADNGVCYNYTDPYTNKFGFVQNYTVHGIWNTTLANLQDPKIKAVLPAEDYLNGEVLSSYHAGSIDNFGTPKWELVLSLLCAWIIVTLSLIKGVKSSGKVVYFTALFPYAVLIILLIRGVTLEGHFEGIKFYILQPQLEKLREAAVWKDAAVQIFFSLSASWGGLIALSSYNRFHNDCLRDSLIVSIGNCLTSFFAGFVIFSFLGFLAHEMGVGVADVANSGVTLAFVVYPEAVIRMPVSPLWAILFFLMLITLGLDSEFALVETITTSIMDKFPQWRKKKSLVIVLTCVIMFLLGLTMTCPGGVYMLQVMDHYSGGWNVLLIAIFECICIVYVYGFRRYREDVRIMIGDFGCFMPWSVCSFYFLATWGFISPGIVIFILVFSWYDYSEVTLGDYKFPQWAAALGWLMTIVVVLGLVATPIILMIQKAVKGKEIIELFRPSRYWGPALPKHRELMSRYLSPDDFEIDPYGDDEVDLEHVKPDMGNNNPGFMQSNTKF